MRRKDREVTDLDQIFEYDPSFGENRRVAVFVITCLCVMVMESVFVN